MNNFQEKNFLSVLYGQKDLIKSRGNFLKKYSNRKYSLRTFILKLIPIKSGSKILDIGCGECSFLEKLNKKYPNNNYFGLDIVKNENCLKCNFIDYRIYNGMKFPKGVNGFDYIFCMHTIYHVDNLKRLFSEMKNNLNKNGIIVITTKSKFTFPKIEFIFQRIIRSLSLNKKISISKYRDESKFCLENGLKILQKYFPKKYFKIEEYVMENQIIINNKSDLLKYIFSTARYNLEEGLNNQDLAKKYKKLWENYISEMKFFIDKYIEVIYVIKKI